VKLTQLGLDREEELARANLGALARRALEQDGFVWVDMESTPYREATLRVYEAVRREVASVGICLQAYLRSTPEDLEKLLEDNAVIRIVKGAYAEAREVAFQRKRDVDTAFYDLTRKILEGPGRVAVATHDPLLIERIRATVRELEAEKNRYEFQMLFGIGEGTQLRLAKAGEPVRVLISYGPAWFPWYMRRLAERPANLWFVLKNLLRR
jgi:proline dehydrogenase